VHQRNDGRNHTANHPNDASETGKPNRWKHCEELSFGRIKEQIAKVIEVTRPANCCKEVRYPVRKGRLEELSFET